MIIFVSGTSVPVSTCYNSRPGTVGQVSHVTVEPGTTFVACLILTSPVSHLPSAECPFTSYMVDGLKTEKSTEKKEVEDDLSL